MSDSELLDFDAVEQILNGAGASWEAAEAHGAFCGRACLGGANAIRAWVGGILEEGSTGDVLQRERAGKLELFAANTLLALEAGEFGFKLLLPDDDEPLYIRTAGLADWCHGFMQGLVVAGGADEGPQADALESSVVTEILQDFTEITKAGSGEDDSEEAEQAFVELVEYVRVSVQLIYDETIKIRSSLAGGGTA
jgi:uncharacterized protein YgfB (UPF0149 family)